MSESQKTMTAIESAVLGIDLNDAGDVQDLLDQKLFQLESLLTVTRGDGGESFRGYSEDIQEGFLWACSELAGECRRLSELLPALRMSTQE